jgi:hypothetical protein
MSTTKGQKGGGRHHRPMAFFGSAADTSHVSTPAQDDNFLGYRVLNKSLPYWFAGPTVPAPHSSQVSLSVFAKPPRLYSAAANG